MNEPSPGPVAALAKGVPCPSIYFLTVHKGASSFIAAALAPRLSVDLSLATVLVGNALLHESDDIDLASRNFAYQSTGNLYTQLYPDAARHIDFRGTRTVALIRDPRDVAVSWYYSLAYSHPPLPGEHGRRLREERERMRKLTVRAGVKRIAPWCIQEFKIVQQIVAEHPNILVTRYEHMVTDFRSWFDEVVVHLQLTLDREPYYALQSEFVVDREDVRRHKRRVTPGNWREVFDDELRRYFADELGPSVREHGYEW